MGKVFGLNLYSKNKLDFLSFSDKLIYSKILEFVKGLNTLLDGLFRQTFTPMAKILNDNFNYSGCFGQLATNFA